MMRRLLQSARDFLRILLRPTARDRRLLDAMRDRAEQDRARQHRQHRHNDEAMRQSARNMTGPEEEK